MTFGITGPEEFVKNPAGATFVSETLAEKAANGTYRYRKAYQALRSLTPQELFDLYTVWKRDGNEAFRNAFGPVYHRAAGEEPAGPLFAESQGGSSHGI